ncbi:MAG TPA: hypothetical protein VMN39_03750, partial [Longimicrobiaceae bacterium]|nr:hypothetical protein [Longimicrobiaceae bacterium]
WSVGDQRSEYPGHLFRIDPSTGRLLEKPIPLEVPPRKEGESAEVEAYRGILLSIKDSAGKTQRHRAHPSPPQSLGPALEAGAQGTGTTPGCPEQG